MIIEIQLSSSNELCGYYEELCSGATINYKLCYKIGGSSSLLVRATFGSGTVGGTVGGWPWNSYYSYFVRGKVYCFGIDIVVSCKPTTRCSYNYL